MGGALCSVRRGVSPRCSPAPTLPLPADPACCCRNLAALRALAKNWVPLLLSTFVATTPVQRGQVEEAIAAYACCCDPGTLATFFRAAITKLIKVHRRWLLTEARAWVEGAGGRAVHWAGPHIPLLACGVPPPLPSTLTAAPTWPRHCRWRSRRRQGSWGRARCWTAATPTPSGAAPTCSCAWRWPAVWMPPACRRCTKRPSRG